MTVDRDTELWRESDQREKAGGKAVLFLLFVLAALAGGAYVAAYLTAGDKVPRGGANLTDAFDIGRCGHRSLDQRQIVGTRHVGCPGFEEVGDVDGARDVQQLVLAVEQGELATVARRELPHREPGPLTSHHHSPGTASSGPASAKE